VEIGCTEEKMAVFEYEIITNTGNTETGNIEAETIDSANHKLRGSGNLVVDIKEKKKKKTRSGGKVKLADLSIFSRQLAAMLNAGIPLTRALFTLSRQVSNQSLKNALSDIAGNVESGMSLTNALSNHKNIFSDLYIGMINAGEVGGTLEETLSRLSDQLQKEKGLKDSIRSATFYPSMIVFFALFVMVAMLVFLVPIFIGMFPPGLELPLPTQIVVSISDSIRGYWYLWIITIFIIYNLLRLFIRSTAGKNIWDRIKFNIPIFGDLIQKAVIARFTRTLSTLLTGGIPIMQALDAAGPTSGSLMVAKAVNKAREKIHEGKSIAGPLEDSGLFPPMVIQMISVGEETGALSSLLNRIAEFYEEEVAVITKGLTAMLEPVLLIIVGLMVGGMVIALYLPIFTAVTQF
jgi:type IV pilus assembly protein PilC